jgi:hypothetical protein
MREGGVVSSSTKSDICLISLIVVVLKNEESKD